MKKKFLKINLLALKAWIWICVLWYFDLLLYNKFIFKTCFHHINQKLFPVHGTQKRRSKLSGPWQIMCWQLQIWARELIKRRRLPNVPKTEWCSCSPVAHRRFSGAVGSVFCSVVRSPHASWRIAVGQSATGGQMRGHQVGGWVFSGPFSFQGKLTSVYPLMGFQMRALRVHLGATWN